MSYKLSILIPSLESRQDKCLLLVDKLLDQIERNNLFGLVEVVTLADKGESPTGKKRNQLIQMAKGEYICFVDDDDEVSINYIDLILDGIQKGVDCCSLRGVMTWNGGNPQIFEHSIKYKAYKQTENKIVYERYPNHLNAIKKSIAKQVKFPEIFQGEDTLWATEIFNRGLIKTEHYIDNILYYYKFISNK